MTECCDCLVEINADGTLDHACNDCATELTEKQCKEYGGLCYDCMYIIANF